MRNSRPYFESNPAEAVQCGLADETTNKPFTSCVRAFFPLPSSAYLDWTHNHSRKKGSFPQSVHFLPTANVSARAGCAFTVTPKKGRGGERGRGGGAGILREVAKDDFIARRRW